MVNPETGWPKDWYTKSRLLFWGCLYIGLHDFRNFRSDLEDFKDIKCHPEGFRPDFKAFRSRFMDFRPDFIGISGRISRGAGLISGTSTRISMFSSRFSEISGRITQITGIARISGWISGILGRN